MAITLSEQVVNFFQKARMQLKDIRHWPKGGIRILLLCLLAALFVSAALRGVKPAHAATIIDVPCGTPINISGNDITVRLQPCTYPSMYFGGFPGVLEGNGATIDLTNSAYAATVLGTNVTVRDIRVINSTQRGGIFTPGSNVTLERVVVTGNRSVQDPGGGILATNGVESLTLIDCTISNNTGRYGAGLWIHPDFNGGVIRILRSTISGNHAVFTPGDVVSGLGGGLWMDYTSQRQSTLEITNSTISGNRADMAGGAMFLNGTVTGTINDSTITGNSAGVDADAIRDYTGGVPNPGLALRRSIVAGNGQDSVPDCSGFYHDFKHDYGNNVLVSSCADTLGVESTTKVVASNEVKLGVLADNGGLTKTHLPLADSPVLNMIPAGSAGCTPGSTDQRGVARPQSTGCDSGSVEKEAAANTPPTIAGTTLARTAGSPATNSQIATVNDTEDGVSLAVTVNGGSSATVNGITVSSLSVNSLGQVTASVGANCTATTAAFTLRVTDGGGLFNEATLDVTVNSNPPPSLGTYPATSVTAGSSVTVTPGAAPTDNGSVANLTALAPGFTGTFSGNPTTGAITITNANPPGSYTVTVTATDNCGVRATRTFALTVIGCLTVNPATLAQPYLAVPYAQVFSASPAANTGVYTYSVSAGALPPGLQLVTALGVTSIAGLPTRHGTYNFTIKVRHNITACEGTRSYTVTIPKTVVPILECVQRNANGTYTARFGYDNSTGAAVTIPVGASNYFTPGNQNRSQTTVFQPGRVVNAFSVTFKIGTGNGLAVWYLKGPDNMLRPVSVLTTSPGCP